MAVRAGAEAAARTALVFPEALLEELFDEAVGSTELVWDADAIVRTEINDANGTETVATFDPLGRARTTAIRNGSDGDGGAGRSGEPSPAAVDSRP